MTDSVAWCILAGFKITSVFSRIIYHTVESICEFAVSSLQGYICGGKKSVDFTVTENNQRKREPTKLIKNESRNSEEPKHKNFYCKTNESTDMTKSKLTISGQRFCFHGTDKIMEYNLHDAKKVTVSFNFYPSRNQSMIGFGSPSHGAQDPQKEMVENDNSSEKPKMYPDPKQANDQLNQNEIERNESKFKYKDVSKLSDETNFMTESNMHAAKNALEISSDGKDVSINGCGASYKKYSGALSDEQHIEHSVVHLSQDLESLVDKRVTHEQYSLDSADKQWPDNHTVGERQKPETSFDHSCDKKQDSKILVDEEMRATTINRECIVNDPEHSGKNQTTSHIEEKQIQETLSENQQSDIKKDLLIHSEQYQTPSAHLPITRPAFDTDTPVPETVADKNKLLTASTTDKNRHGPDSPIDRKPMPAFPVNENNLVSESTADKNLMTASFLGKNPGLVAPANTQETPTSAPKADTLTNNDEKPVPGPVEDRKSIPELATDNINSYCPANKDKPVPTPAVNEPVPTPEAYKDKPLPVPATDKKLKPESPANKHNSILPSAVDEKPVTASVVETPMRESPADNDKNPIPELVTDKKAKPEWHANKESVTAPEKNKDKALPVLADENLTPSSNANKEKSVPAEDKKLIHPSEAGKEPVSASEVDKKHILELGIDKKTKPEWPVNRKSVPAPEMNEHKPLPVPADEKLTPSSPANKEEKLVPAAGKKIIPPSEAVEEPVSASAVDKKSTPESPDNDDMKLVPASAVDKPIPEYLANNDKPVPVPTADKKRTPESPAKKKKKPLQEPISQKNESSAPVSLANQKPVSESLVDKINMAVPESTTDKHIPASAIDKEPISATGDSYRVENVSEVPEKFEVREINEDGNIDSSLTKELRSQRGPIDTGGSDEEFSGDFNKMLEKGPSIVIGPDILLNPNMLTYDSGNSRYYDSNIEMSSKYVQDGWDDSDKCFYEYVIEREKEMGQFDPSAFKNECSNEMARSDENKSKGENIQRDSHMYGKIIDKYNPLTEVPKYYDLIAIVDSKYVLQRSLIKCYKKREVTDNVAGTEGTNNTDDPNVSSKEQSTSHQYNIEKQSTRETGNANFSEGISAFGKSPIILLDSEKNVKTLKELGARPKTSRGRGTRK